RFDKVRQAFSQAVVTCKNDAKLSGCGDGLVRSGRRRNTQRKNPASLCRSARTLNHSSQETGVAKNEIAEFPLLSLPVRIAFFCVASHGLRIPFRILLPGSVNEPGFRKHWRRGVV